MIASSVCHPSPGKCSIAQSGEEGLLVLSQAGNKPRRNPAEFRARRWEERRQNRGFCCACRTRQQPAVVGSGCDLNPSSFSFGYEELAQKSTLPVPPRLPALLKHWCPSEGFLPGFWVAVAWPAPGWAGFRGRAAHLSEQLGQLDEYPRLYLQTF